MVNVLLISPPEQHLMMEAGDRPNLGLLYIASSLKNSGHEVILSDLNNDSYYDLNNKIKDFNPEFIGIYTMTPYYNWICNFSKHLRHRYPNIKLIAGGPHATILPETLTDYFDFIVKGEGEKVILDIVEHKTDSKIIIGQLEQNLDSIEMPLRSLLGPEYSMKFYGTNGTIMIASRSCPFNCFFCTKSILGNKQRSHSVDYVIEELKELKNIGYNGVYFQDDCFTFDKKKCMKLAERMIQEQLNMKYMIITRADMVDYELLKIMKESGLICISFGFEHMNDEVLSIIKKSCSTKKNIEAIELCKKLGIKIKANFILNLPKATKETMYECLEYSKKYNIDSAMFYTLIAYPETELWNNPEKYDCTIISKDYTHDKLSNSSNVEVKGINNKDLIVIVDDIRKKWEEFKGTKATWER